MWFLALSLFFFLSGANIFVALGLGSALVMIFYFNLPAQSVGQLMLGRVSSYTLLAMPLFMLAGHLLINGGGTKRFIAFFEAWIGHFPGGLLAATVAFCIFFAAMTGSSYATIAAVGTIMLPEMKKAGYSDSLRSGVVACSGHLGNLIPPSLSMIVVGALTERSVATLFAAGLVPGLIIGIGTLILGTIIAISQGVSKKPPASWRTRGTLFVKAFPCLLMPIVILGAIYTGFATPTEAAAVSCFYAMLIGLVIYGELRSWQAIKTSFVNAAKSAVMIYMIMAGVVLFSNVISRSGMAVAMVNFIIDLGVGRLGLVIILNTMLLGLGFFISPFSLMYMAIPILLPICAELGINLVWLGVLWLMNALIGSITPPMAGGLYITARVADLPPGPVFRGAIPFLGVWVTVLFLVIFFPDVALWVPRIMGMPGA